ncbi:CD63 antigen-like [Amphiura filiformis]|uniref:CD63 antigen-like n=1 Tax=Amphiura filiformis TaxID=82378 RepID=UPI003B22598A
MACCSGIAKIILIVVNLCVWIVGIALIGVGSLVLANSEEYSAWFGDQDTITVVSGFTIGIGCVIFFVGFCGCYGAMSKTVCFLQIYFGFLAVIVVLEIIAGVLAFVYQDEIKEVVADSIQEAVKGYGTFGFANKTLDALQEDFSCCGADGIADWKDVPWGEQQENIDANRSAPESCCSTPEEGCNDGTGPPGTEPTDDKMNSKGCVDEFQVWLQNNYLIIGAVCLGLLAFEILAMVFACCLIKEKEDK